MEKINVNLAEPNLSVVDNNDAGVINIGKERCADYQNNKYSDIFFKRVQKILSVVNKDFTKQNYLDPKMSNFLNKEIKKISIENGNHHMNGINISEILFIEKE